MRPELACGKSFLTGRICEAACRAHARRKFHDIHAAHPSPTTTGAPELIGTPYCIEQDIRGESGASGGPRIWHRMLTLVRGVPATSHVCLRRSCILRAEHRHFCGRSSQKDAKVVGSL